MRRPALRRSAPGETFPDNGSRGRVGSVAVLGEDDFDDSYDSYDEHATATRPPRRRWPFAMVLTIVVVLVLGGAYLVGYSSVLAVRSVVVTGSGAQQLSTQVRAAVDVPTGTPLARVDLAGVQRRVAAIGSVASVSVQRQWPHTLLVSVVARVPVAVTQADGRWWLLDATGKPYQPVSSPPDGLMTIQLATPAQGDRATLAALGVLGSLPPAFRKTVASVTAPTAYSISLALSDGRTVVWGADEDTALKLQVLPAVLTRAGRVFDISDPTLVTVH